MLLAGAQPVAGAVVTETVSVPPNGLASATPACPKGQRATGGGNQAPPRIPGRAQVAAQESRKIGQRRWMTTFSQSSTLGVSQTATAIVYCQKKENAPKTKEVAAAATSTADYEAFTTADAVCPSGRTIQAGGFSQATTAQLIPFGDTIESYRVAEDTWRARMVGETGAQIGSYAYCAKRKPPTEAIGSVLANGQNNVSAVSPPCEVKRKAVAGGFSQPNADPSSGYAFAFSDLVRVGKSWQASAGHFGAPTQLNSIVYCAKKPE